MQDAGAAAIELNIYYLPGDPQISGRDVEQRHIDVLERVKAAVTVPVAVKLSPYFSSIGEIAVRLDRAGADALVLFNRFLQPDIDPEQLVVLPRVNLSSPSDGRLPRTWIALLRGSGQRLARGDDRRRGPGRCGALPARGRRRGDEHLGAAAPRTPVRRGSCSTGSPRGWRARGSTSLDELRGMLAVPADARPGGGGARRLRLCDAGSQRGRVRPVVGRSVQARFES